MIRPTLSTRRNRDHRRSSLPQDDQNSVNRKGGGHDGYPEAAVERWLTSPAEVKGTGRAPGRSRSRSSDKRRDQNIPGSLELPSFETSEAATRTRSMSSVSGGAVAHRGKHLLRERLKRKAEQMERLRQDPKRLEEEKDKDKDNGPSNLSVLNVDTEAEVIDLTNYGKEQEATTPSTAASTRSSASKACSVRHAMSGLTLSDSQSPSASGHGTMETAFTQSSPAGYNLARTLSSPNKASRGRRSIDVSNDTPCDYGQSPISSRSKSPRHSNASGDASPRSIHSIFDPSGPLKDISCPPPPPESARRVGIKLSRISTSPAAVSRAEGKTLLSMSGCRRSSSRSQQSLPQHEFSDEEREKVDKRTMQRVGQAASSDKRQDHASSLGKTNRIRLHVYDLISEETIMQLPWGCHFPIGQCFNAVNSGLHTLGTGAYHVGIEINGIEYAYGANDTRGSTGVFTCMPQHSPGYQFRTTIDFGDRALIRNVQSSRRGDDSQKPAQRYVDGREVVREMAAEYMGLDYDLLRKNCVTFAHDACLRLGVHESEVPEWFRNLCLAGAAAQDAANSTIAPLTQVFSSCDMEGLAGIVKDAGFEVINDDSAGGHIDQIVDTETAYCKTKA